MHYKFKKLNKRDLKLFLIYRETSFYDQIIVCVFAGCTCVLSYQTMNHKVHILAFFSRCYILIIYQFFNIIRLS